MRTQTLNIEQREVIECGDEHGDEQMVALVDDVEDTIIEALGLYRQDRHKCANKTYCLRRILVIIYTR
jgi:hypothetical protein